MVGKPGGLEERKREVQKQIADMERSLMSCTRFRRHRVRCFMEQEVRHGEKAHGYEYVARFALGGLATVFAGVMPSSLVRNRRPVSGLPGHLLCQRHTR